MLTRRMIPCLDVRDGKVVKGVRFRDHAVMGEIVDLALRYRDEGADELVFYDITASPEGRAWIAPGWNAWHGLSIFRFAWRAAFAVSRMPAQCCMPAPTRSRSIRRRWKTRS